VASHRDEVLERVDDQHRRPRARAEPGEVVAGSGGDRCDASYGCVRGAAQVVDEETTHRESRGVYAVRVHRVRLARPADDLSREIDLLETVATVVVAPWTRNRKEAVGGIGVDDGEAVVVGHPIESCRLAHELGRHAGAVVGDQQGHPSLVVIAQRQVADKRALTSGERHRSDELTAAVPLGKLGEVASPGVGGSIIRAP